MLQRTRLVRPPQTGYDAVNTGMRIGSLPSITAGFVVVCTLVFAELASAQNDSDLTSDEHFREELGVNQYTTPSIEQLFNTLNALKPIPFQALVRAPRPVHFNNRVQFALSFGILIGDAFLAVEAEESGALEPIARELLRRAKALGVERRVSSHSKELLDLAKESDWTGLRKELIVTQIDVEKAMLDLRDEEMAHFISLGGWIRGLEIGAASVATEFSAQRAALLGKLDLLDYYIQRLNTLSPPLKSTPLISQIIESLREIRQKLTRSSAITQADAQDIQNTAQHFVVLIEGGGSGAAANASN
ncbi:MAG: hypothetical protein JOZ61_05255 [Verrucomicrobia bacterium]|nr:hypothetical protein [Verrucomicrobiota bacterium]